MIKGIMYDRVFGKGFRFKEKVDSDVFYSRQKPLAQEFDSDLYWWK